MAIESLPTFTKPARARQRWESIPADIRPRLLSNVWCRQCRHETRITNFSGTIRGVPGINYLGLRVASRRNVTRPLVVVAGANYAAWAISA